MKRNFYDNQNQVIDLWCNSELFANQKKYCFYFPTMIYCHN